MLFLMQYQKYPLITKQRMFYETMEEVLPDLKVIIESPSGEMQTFYPIESFATFGTNGSQTTGSNTGSTVDSSTGAGN